MADKYWNNKRNSSYSRNESAQMINKPLSVFYQDKAELYLENGAAYRQAEKLKFVKVHQVRKYLTVIKECAETSNFTEARNKLYSRVPLAAYNAGRDRNLNGLYDFIHSHINRESIQSKEDIEVLDELFTSIIAYHKYLA